jgi:P27 family predicted phage terminase small subunit
MANRPGQGRRPKPTEEHKLAGTFRTARHIDNTEAFELVTALTPPPYLSALAAQQYMEIGGQLLNAGVLKSTDLPAFAALCRLQSLEIEYTEAMQRWEAETAEMAENAGLDKWPYPGIRIDGRDVQVNPYIKLIMNITPELNRMRAEFGLTPSSRSRIPVTKQKAGSKWNKFAAPAKNPV